MDVWRQFSNHEGRSVGDRGQRHEFPGAVGLDREIEWHFRPEASKDVATTESQESKSGGHFWKFRSESGEGLQSYSLPLQGTAESFLGAKIWQDMVNSANTNTHEHASRFNSVFCREKFSYCLQQMHHGCCLMFLRCRCIMSHFEVVAGSRLKDWPGHKPSRAPSWEVHLAQRQA
eukprot:s255_g43.t2